MLKLSQYFAKPTPPSPTKRVALTTFRAIRRASASIQTGSRGAYATARLAAIDIAEAWVESRVK